MKKITASDFDFYLPEELIAQEPLKKRDASRLLLLDKESGKIKHEHFKNIDKYFKGDEILVRNNSKVVPARLFGIKESGAKIEILLNKKLKKSEEGLIWEVLAKPARRLHAKDKIIFKKDLLEATVLERRGETFLLNFKFKGIFEEVLNELGKLPLPKYIRKELKDKDRYQTIYAKSGESVAAPTAGLHFTDDIFKRLQAKGVKILDINLNVGLGTFAPVRDDNLKKHKMHSESFYIDPSVADEIRRGRDTGSKVVALGTTVVRALESAAKEDGTIQSGYQETDIFIKPGFNFKVVDALITNFHLPKSTLIMLVSAFASKDFVLNAYKEAVKEKYRFFSFGDAMFINNFKL